MIRATTSQSHSEEEQELYDTKRLKDLKKLIWMAVKRTKEEGVRSADFINILQEIIKSGSN